MKILIFDRQELFRVALRHILSQHELCEEVLEARSTSDLVSLATLHDDIDLLIAYPRSVDLCTADCIRLAERLLDGANLVLFRDGRPTDEADFPDVTFLDRNAGAQDVLSALGTRPSATAPVSPILLHPAADCAASEAAGPCRNLSRRQKQIMRMVAEGLANKEIAARLGIAEGTVKAHIHAVFKALGVTNRTQAVVRFGGELRQIG